jgi:hypothetical protein
MANTNTAGTEQRPIIQIDDIEREMNDEEYAQYLEDQANKPEALAD